MKPFLGIDITHDTKNEKINGDEFLVAKTSSAMSDSLMTSTENAVDMIERSKLPFAIRIGQLICGAVGVITAGVVLKVLIGNYDITPAQAYQNAPGVFWLAGICLVAWLILKIISIKKRKSIIESHERDHLISKLDTITDNIFAELGVPETSQAVDILSFSYKIKDGMPVARERGLVPTPYNNFEYKIFIDSDNLYLVDLEGKYSFPLAALSAIRTVKKSISVPNWNKDTDPDKGIYKQFKLTVGRYDCIYFKPYYILEFEHNGEIWGIYFPNYELPTFESLTGLSAE